MQKIFSFLAVICLISAITTGCSNLKFPGVYKLTIEQGNVITQEMIDQLKPGMTRDQVEFILGSPLIKDSFNSDRWDYVYNIQPGNEPREQHRIAVFFTNDKLTSFTGDFVPSPPKEQAANP